jgi:hypothetical protein
MGGMEERRPMKAVINPTSRRKYWVAWMLVSFLVCWGSLVAGPAVAYAYLEYFPIEFPRSISPFAKAGRLLLAGGEVCIVSSLVVFAIGLLSLGCSLAYRQNEWE